MSTERYIATVDWRSPQHGGYAELTNKLLSLGELSDDTRYIAFDNDHGSERYLFDSRAAALAFKLRAEDGYSKAPQYFVIDDNGERVEEDGQPLVAWTPEITVSLATEEQLDQFHVIA